MWLLENAIRNYAWGSHTHIPELLGISPDGEPWAELWIGAHPDGSSVVSDGPLAKRPLCDVLTEQPELLGSAAPRLTYLAKLLAAAQPLSLQVHPNEEQAAVGFTRDRTSPPHLRNYRDPFSKPEILIALTPFVAMAGFRDPRTVLADIDALDSADARTLSREVQAAVAANSYTDLVHWILTRGSSELDVVSLVTDLMSLPVQPHNDPKVLLPNLFQHYFDDPGILVALCLNVITLQPGQAIYVPAGVMHSYVSGFGLEVMGASDNVVRGGLTPKHIDVAELCHLLDATPRPVQLIHPVATAPGFQQWHCPTTDFAVGQYTLAGSTIPVQQTGSRIAICLSGTVSCTTQGDRRQLTPGRAVFIPALSKPVSLSGNGSVAMVWQPESTTEMPRNVGAHND